VSIGIKYTRSPIWGACHLGDFFQEEESVILWKSLSIGADEDTAALNILKISFTIIGIHADTRWSLCSSS